jgi:phosphoribosylamine--glycine ligase
MNVLLIGSGGREHAIALKIRQSKNLNKLFCAPGNPGTESFSENVSIDILNHNTVVDFCIKNKIDLVVVGPEQPLVEGLANSLIKNNIKVFGPTAAAARIESSKSFAKEVMISAGVATAIYKEFTVENQQSAFEYIRNQIYPVVIKADGLAAGKGVIICQSKEEAESALKDVFESKIFGESGSKVVIEEFLEGEEASVFAITDGEKFICLPAAQDHKRIGDGDTGKNTGGMGAYAPAPIVNDKIMYKIESEIIASVLKKMNDMGNKFVGCLYAGLMIKDSVPKVIEFNCRFGDPETQVVLPIIEGDLLELLYSAASGNLNKNSVEYSGGCAVCVVASSVGYPDVYKKGFEIMGFDKISKDIIVYHAGTKKIDDKILTNGGRVLGVTSVLEKNDLRLAKKIVYEEIKKIDFEGIYYRKDIADKAFKYMDLK